MTKKYPILTALVITFILTTKTTYGQYYDIADYHYNGTPVHGIKIKTKIPFLNGGSMPTIRIEGYNYGQSEPIGLDIVWYVFNNRFTHIAISSWGAYTPPVYLSDENGLISIFIDDRGYFQRFHISAYAKGESAETAANFSGWTIADEALNGNHEKLIPYKNKYAGKVVMEGTLLIGKNSQTNTSYKLDVNGSIRADKVVVNTTGADYVFDSTYHLLPLDSLTNYLKQNLHLPDIPSAKKMRKEGVSVGDNQIALLKKIEELTLYIIAMHKNISKQNQIIKKLEKQLNNIE